MADTLAVVSHGALGRQDLIFRIEQRLLDGEETVFASLERFTVLRWGMVRAAKT